METLHITNGDSLTERLLELSIQGDILTWDEMLCEGPTTERIDAKEYLKIRKDFFNDVYNLDFHDEKFFEDINKLNNADTYKEIVLWFEYDLFCHINLVAVISLIKQKQINLPVYLVCSGRIEAKKALKDYQSLHKASF